MTLLELAPELIEAGDVRPVEELVAEIEGSPRDTRMFQGRLRFLFPGQAEGGEPFSDPDVLAWGRSVYGRIPHLLYFTSPGRDALDLVTFSFAGWRGQGAARHLLEAALFAESMADDWRPIVASLVEPLESELAASVLETVEAALSLASVRR